MVAIFSPVYVVLRRIHKSFGGVYVGDERISNHRPLETPGTNFFGGELASLLKYSSLDCGIELIQVFDEPRHRFDLHCFPKLNMGRSAI